MHPSIGGATYRPRDLRNGRLERKIEARRLLVAECGATAIPIFLGKTDPADLATPLHAIGNAQQIRIESRLLGSRGDPRLRQATGSPGHS